MTFTLTPLSHYNFITKPRVYFLLSLLKDISINFPSHFISSILDVYLDTTTRDKLIFLLAITCILWHFSIPIPDSPNFTTMGAISADSIPRSGAQLRSKWPWTKTIDHANPAAPPSLAPSTFAPSSSAVGHLDSLTDEMCQMNTRVGRIVRWQACLGGFAPSLSPSLEASTDEDGDAVNDEDKDATSSGDNEMMTSRWLALCHLWQKGGVVLDESSLVFRGRISIGVFLLGGVCILFKGCSEVFMYFFLFFFFYILYTGLVTIYWHTL